VAEDATIAAGIWDAIAQGMMRRAADGYDPLAEHTARRRAHVGAGGAWREHVRAVDAVETYPAAFKRRDAPVRPCVGSSAERPEYVLACLR
jgi:hypothetical protein